MIEPIALGRPTIVGTHHPNFADTVAALRAGDGILVSDEPGRLAAELLGQPQRAAEFARRGRQVILGRQGATDRHIELLADMLARRRAGPLRAPPPSGGHAGR
jgi:3-deoxy-D-manno-octulosonic-acid transferase